MAGCRGLTTGYNCRFDLTGKKQTLFIGDNCEFGDMTHIVAFNNVMIGDNVLMASKVFVSDTNHGFLGGVPIIHVFHLKIEHWKQVLLE